MKIKIATAEGAAWRARYVYLDARKIAHIGVDPTASKGPQAFGSIAGHEFRFNLPTLRYANNMSPLRLRLFKLSQRFWHNMDGRYGWGSKYRAQK